MKNILKRLESLYVRDAMSRRVVLTSAGQPMAEAAKVFLEHGISATPVIDEQGKCVGILSATDFVKREDLVQGEGYSPHVLKCETHEAPYQIVPVRDAVAAHMTAAVQSISPEASLFQAAQMMCGSHIHRLIVLDENSRPIGVISTMDIVAALLNAVDEAQLDEARTLA